MFAPGLDEIWTSWKIQAEADFWYRQTALIPGRCFKPGGDPLVGSQRSTDLRRRDVLSEHLHRNATQHRAIAIRDS